MPALRNLIFVLGLLIGLCGLALAQPTHKLSVRDSLRADSLKNSFAILPDSTLLQQEVSPRKKATLAAAVIGIITLFVYLLYNVRSR